MNATIVVICCFTICFISDLSLGHSFKTCNLNKSDFKTCISFAIEDALKKLKDPMPEFDLPSFDPLNITKLNIPESHKNVSLAEHLNYLDIYGIPVAEVKSFNYYFQLTCKNVAKKVAPKSDFELCFSINFDSKTTNLVLWFSNLTLEASLNFKGEILGDHIHFAGHAKAVDLNSSFKIHSKFEEHGKDEKKYIKIVDGHLDFDVGNDTLTFEDKNKDEEKHYVKLMKEHRKKILSGFLGDYEKIFFGAYAKYFNLILAKISVTDLFGV